MINFYDKSFGVRVASKDLSVLLCERPIVNTRLKRVSLFQGGPVIIVMLNDTSYDCT